MLCLFYNPPTTNNIKSNNIKNKNRQMLKINIKSRINIKSNSLSKINED